MSFGGVVDHLEDLVVRDVWERAFRLYYELSTEAGEFRVEPSFRLLLVGDLGKVDVCSCALVVLYCCCCGLGCFCCFLCVLLVSVIVRLWSLLLLFVVVGLVGFVVVGVILWWSSVGAVVEVFDCGGHGSCSGLEGGDLALQRVDCLL